MEVLSSLCNPYLNKNVKRFFMSVVILKLCSLDWIVWKFTQHNFLKFSVKLISLSWEFENTIVGKLGGYFLVFEVFKDLLDPFFCFRQIFCRLSC